MIDEAGGKRMDDLAKVIAGLDIINRDEDIRNLLLDTNYERKLFRTVRKRAWTARRRIGWGDENETDGVMKAKLIRAMFIIHAILNNKDEAWLSDAFEKTGVIDERTSS